MITTSKEKNITLAAGLVHTTNIGNILLQCGWKQKDIYAEHQDIISTKYCY